MIRKPDDDQDSEQDADIAAARAEAIAEATCEALVSATQAFSGATPEQRAYIAIGCVGLAIRMLEWQPETALETWLSYQAEGEQLIHDGKFASAAWSTRTANIAISQIAEQGRIIATEAWPFIPWLPAYFIETTPGGTIEALRSMFGDAILLMPSWLETLQD